MIIAQAFIFLTIPATFSGQQAHISQWVAYLFFFFFFVRQKHVTSFISETLGKHQIQISKVIVAHCDVEICVTTLDGLHIKCPHLDKSFSPLPSHHVNMQHKKNCDLMRYILSQGAFGDGKSYTI